MPAKNVVEIVVKARTSVREGFDAARKEAENAGRDAGVSYTERFVGTVAVRMRERIAAPAARIGQEMGERIGEHTSRGVARVVARGIASIPGRAEAETAGAGRRVGDSIGRSAGGPLIERMREHFRRLSAETRGDNEREGDAIGNTLGQRIRDRIRERVRGSGGSTTVVRSDSGDNDRDRDRRRLGDWLKSGFEAATAWADGFGDKISAFFSGDVISMIVKAFAVGGLATALSPVIGGAITTAVLGAVGGGVLAAGIAGAFKDPRIQGAATDLKNKLSKTFEEFGKPFRGPVANFLENFSGMVDRLAPKFKKLSESFAPVADKLGDGFVELLENAMPGILDAAEASKPIFETLAKHAPEIGDAISEFFSIIAGQGDDANLFFSDLLDLIEAMLPLLGGMIATMTSGYNYISEFVHGAIDLFQSLDHEIFMLWNSAKASVLAFVYLATGQLESLLAAAAASLSWIPGIGDKLKVAQEKFKNFRKRVNDEVDKIRGDVRIRIVTEYISKYVTIGSNAANNSYEETKRKIRGYAHGGIVGMASGGIGAGLRLVGEHGPELAEIAPGGRVYSNPDTSRMLNGQGAGGGGETTEVLARWEPSGDPLVDTIMQNIRLYVQRKGRGNVQLAFGQG